MLTFDKVYDNIVTYACGTKWLKTFWIPLYNRFYYKGIVKTKKILVFAVSFLFLRKDLKGGKSETKKPSDYY